MNVSDVAIRQLNPTLRIKCSAHKCCFSGDMFEGKNSSIFQTKKNSQIIVIKI